MTTSSTDETTGTTSTSSTGGGSPCPSCEPSTELGQVANPDIVEASGLAASALHAGVFYTHNDSGDAPRFFAFDESGADLGTYSVTNADAVDWEDMSRGPCADPAKSCLYFGDVGDNPGNRSSYRIYRVEEPTSLSAGAHDVTAEIFTFKYPDGPHNSEAIFVDPANGGVFVLTKAAGDTRLYELGPLTTAATITASFRGQVTIPDLISLVTGADMRSDGAVILVRTYTSVWAFPVETTVTAALVGKVPCGLPGPSEGQGEAVAWTSSGSGYRTISEGAGERLHAMACP